MGCDIHLFVEKKNENGEWELVQGKNSWKKQYQEWADKEENQERKNYYLKRVQEEPETCYEGWLYDNRNYRTFSVLADVRNGISSWRDEPATGHYVKPISEPKGMPDDLPDEMREIYENEYEHSGSYLTLKELLDYDWNQKVKFAGLVSKSEYQEFKNNGSPQSWCGGSNALLISNEDMEKYIRGEITFEKDFINTLIQWELPVKECTYFNEAIETLKTLGKPEDVRIVFWFDS